ncbi:hypothetical protein Tco_0122986 [Tanacetum coccineum]
MDNGLAIHMLTEKKYPLSQEMLSKMLSKRLEVDYESSQAFELLRFMISTEISKITRNPSKTGKHGHEKRKSTKEAKDSKPKPRKVNPRVDYSGRSLLDLSGLPSHTSPTVSSDQDASTVLQFLPQTIIDSFECSIIELLNFFMSHHSLFFLAILVYDVIYWFRDDEEHLILLNARESNCWCSKIDLLLIAFQT